MNETERILANDRKPAQTAAIILAAGAGTRMKSDLPKVAHAVMGRPMVQWVLDAVENAGITTIAAVVGYGREIVEPLVADRAQVAVQEEQLGTAHAVSCASPLLADVDGSIVVVSGDSPLITSATIKRLIDEREASNAAVVVLTMNLADPFGYGRIVRDEAGDVLRIVEQKDATEEEAAIGECNSGFYCFDAHELFEALKGVGSDNAQGEFYLTDVIEISRSKGRRVLGICTENESECLGANTPEQLAGIEGIMRSRLEGSQAPIA